MLEETINRVFDKVYTTSMQMDPPSLTSDTLLLETGLDSLGFAILVTVLHDELGFDPFTLCDDAVYPATFGEFVSFYENFAT